MTCGSHRLSDERRTGAPLTLGASTPGFAVNYLTFRLPTAAAVTRKRE